VGLVSDVRPEVQSAGVSVVPLRHGSGTRLKIIESMALGTPVVSTSKGAEGLDVTHGENILLADDPIEFARCVAQVITDPQLRGRLSSNARQLVENRYDRNMVGHRFEELLRDVVERSKP
jgi:glycosyltransferase involved in cell wall biosynthesis